MAAIVSAGAETVREIELSENVDGSERVVVGKTVGILGFSFLAVKFGLASMPRGVNWRMMFAAGILGGVGFTMSLFVANLAFPAPPKLQDAAKCGIIAGSALAAIGGAALLGWSTRK